MREEKQVVRDFYESYGWCKTTDGFYLDTTTFVDRRPVLDVYRNKTHQRVSTFLPSRGKYLLDAGSGAIPHPEYLDYSATFGRRVCVDLSTQGLMEARAKLGDRGFYVVADITRLPFADDIFDAVLSAHVLYHVPYDEQEAAVRELYRTLAPGRAGVIIYSWPVYWFSLLVAPFVKCAALVRKTSAQQRSCPKERPPLYFRPHDYRWFRRTFGKALNLEIRCWRSVDRLFTRSLVPDNAFGRLVMAVVLWGENRLPHLFGRIGRYPIIILRK